MSEFFEYCNVNYDNDNENVMVVVAVAVGVRITIEGRMTSRSDILLTLNPFIFFFFFIVNDINPFI